MLPRSPVALFGGLADRPKEKSVWRVAKTTTRSTYLPAEGARLPGPGAYSPRRATDGRTSDMANNASRPATSIGARRDPNDVAWPSVAQRPTTSQLRRRTLGDGTTMLLPAPGVDSPEPQCFIGRETTLIKKSRDLRAASAYNDITDRLLPPAEQWSVGRGAPARLPARVVKVAPGAWWFSCHHMPKPYHLS